jgi:hypothetical protein
MIQIAGVTMLFARSLSNGKMEDILSGWPIIASDVVKIIGSLRAKLHLKQDLAR